MKHRKRALCFRQQTGSVGNWFQHTLHGPLGNHCLSKFSKKQLYLRRLHLSKATLCKCMRTSPLL